MTQRTPFYAAVYLVARRADTLLIARRCNTGYADGQYSLVAGHIDSGESAFQALQREAREEAGVDIAIEDMSVVHVMHRNSEDADPARFDIFIQVSKMRGEPSIAEPDKCDDMQWVSLENFSENVVPYVRFALESIEHGQSYSEYGW